MAGEEWPGDPNSGSGKHCSHLRFPADTQKGDPTLHILFSHHKEEKYSISFKISCFPYKQLFLNVQIRFKQ